MAYMQKSDDLLKFYNKKHMSFVSRRGYYQEKIDFFLEELNTIRNDRVNILDIGCNDGELTILYKRFGDVLGIDINKDAINECKKKGLNCLCISVEKLVKKYKNYFDVVIAGDIIEHVLDTDIFLQNIYMVLKKKGILLLTTPNLSSLGRRIMLLFGKNPFIEYSTLLPSEEMNVGHIRYYVVSNLKDQLIAQKFKHIKIYGDIINVAPLIHIPHRMAKFLPNFSRNLLVFAKKP